jgi:hypothetical protein
MGAIYLRYSDGQMTQQTEEELRNLWTSGLIPRQAIYWREGMPDWQLVSTWLGEREAEPATASSPASDGDDQIYTFTVEPTGLTKFLQSILWLNALMGLAALVLDVSSLIQLHSRRTTFEEIMNDPVQGAVGSIQWLVGLVVIIAFLRWTYRAYKNVQGFGAKNLHYSPGWAVGYYFIPFICWVRPVQVMSEIWRASKDPREWNRTKGSPLLAAWWSLFLLYGISFEISQLVIDSAQPNQIPWTVGFAVLSDFVSIPFSIVLYFLITKIYLNQKSLVDGQKST